ncbi:hypothetical protein ACP70R_020524 [Stipagrostis hirtigluma subsp. patula]
MAEELPPGVYFYPSPEECVADYLVPWARREHLQETGTFIFEQDIYAHSPDALRQAYPPGTARGFDRKWYFFAHCRLTGGRGCRGVKTGGSWKVEQKTKKVAETGDGDDEEAEPVSGKRRTYGFHLAGKKTPWLMEEFRSDEVGRPGGAADQVPVLCRIYVSPRADKDDKREILGEGAADDDRKKGNVKPTRIVLDEGYFDALAELLRLRIHGGQGQGAPPPPQPVVPAHHHPQAAPPPLVVPDHQHSEAAPPQAFPGHHHRQAAPPQAVPGHHHRQAATPVGHHHGQLAQQSQTMHQPGIHRYHHGQGMPPTSVHRYHHGQGMPPTGVHRYHQGQPSQLRQPPVLIDQYYQPAPASFHGLKLEDEAPPAEKKPRLTYDAVDAPPPPPQGMASSMLICQLEVSALQKQGIMIKRHGGDHGYHEEPCVMIKLYDDDQRRGTDAGAVATKEPEPVPASPPPQPPPPPENPGNPASPRSSPEAATLHPPPPDLTLDDACQEDEEALRGGFMDAAQMPFSDDAPDLAMLYEFQPPSCPDFDDTFPLDDLFRMDGVPKH